MNNNYLTVSETAEYFNIPIAQIYKLCKKRGFPALKFGRQIRVKRDELDTWFAKQTQH